ncbi:hypothetical protein BC827DRAFT_1228035, partial [Russula dissimulans]
PPRIPNAPLPNVFAQLRGPMTHVREAPVGVVIMTAAQMLAQLGTLTSTPIDTRNVTIPSVLEH